MFLKKMMIAAFICGLTTAAFAASIFKTTMYQWRDHQKATANMIAGRAPLDDAAIKAMLIDYVEGAKTLQARMTGSSAEAKDLKQRFAAMQATASAALGQVGNASAVRSETKKVFGQCASCHDVYNN